MHVTGGNIPTHIMREKIHIDEESIVIRRPFSERAADPRVFFFPSQIQSDIGVNQPRVGARIDRIDKFFTDRKRACQIQIVTADEGIFLGCLQQTLCDLFAVTFQKRLRCADVFRQNLPNTFRRAIDKEPRDRFRSGTHLIGTNRRSLR